MSNLNTVGGSACQKPYMGKMESEKVQKNLNLQNGKVRSIFLFEDEVIKFYPYGYCPTQDPPYRYIYGLQPIAFDEQESEQFALWYNQTNHNHEMFVISPIKDDNRFLCQMSKRDFYFGVSVKIAIDSPVFVHLNRGVLKSWLQIFEVDEIVLTIEKKSL